MGPRCFKCLMFSPSGPVELVFLVDLRAAEVCAIVIFMGVVGSDSIFLVCFCFVLGYVCELFSELVGFLFGCYCSVVFEGYCVVCYGCWFFVG